jgi:hypothetical protein
MGVDASVRREPGGCLNVLKEVYKLRDLLLEVFKNGSM